MKKFSLRNVGLVFTLTLFVSLFASNESYAQYVGKTAAVNILVPEVNTLAQNSGALNDVELNTLYFMKVVAEDIHDNNTEVAEALERGLLGIGYRNPANFSNNDDLTAALQGLTVMSTLPGLSQSQYADIKQTVSLLLQ